jgi:hypothetical protein
MIIGFSEFFEEKLPYAGIVLNHTKRLAVPNIDQPLLLNRFRFSGSDMAR